MKGLCITPLDGNNAKKFEDRLIEWITTCSTKSVMLFDKSKLIFCKGAKVKGESSVYRIELTQIYVEYISINDDMCILRKVGENDGENNQILYQMPSNWERTCTCYIAR